jgi:uncharacterized protein YjbJ (UPF0337 family)
MTDRAPRQFEHLCDDAQTWQATWLKLQSWLARRPFTGIRYQEQGMNMNKDQVEGRVKESEGKIKEVVGKLMGNETLELKGKVQKALGEAQAKVGDIKHDMRDLKNDA